MYLLIFSIILLLSFVLTNISVFQLVCLINLPAVSYTSDLLIPHIIHDSAAVSGNLLNLFIDFSQLRDWDDSMQAINFSFLNINYSSGPEGMFYSSAYSHYNIIVFDAYTSFNSIKFYPLQSKLYCIQQEPVLAFFRIENTSNKLLNGLAIYSIYPPQNSIFFVKLQCFCYEQLNIAPNQKVNLPILFYISSFVESNFDVNSTFFLQYNLIAVS